MSAPSSSIDSQVQALLRAQEMSGERLVNKIRFVYGLAGLGMAIAAAEVNTPAANQVFLVQGTALVVACVLLFAFFRATRDAWFPWLKYLTIAFDIGIVHLAVVASARNHSGVIEYFHSFFPLILVLWNLLSGLRTSVAACLWSAFVTATMGSVVLAMILHYDLVPISATSVWGQNALNIADEGMRLAFVSMSGLVAAVLAHIARGLIRRAEEESQNRAALERQKARLSKYLGGELARAVVAEDQDFELGGARRHATIMFTDIRNFTQLSQGTAPEQTVGMLNEYFTEMVDIVFRYGGTLDKFLGDGLMAVYGAPFDRQLAPLRAVLTALEMVRAVDRLNERAGASRAPLRIGAGIATGDVIAGNIGSLERMEYTVIGDAVNLAARLETLNRELGTAVVICPETQAAVGELIPCRRLPPLKIKGMTGEHQLYMIDPATLTEARLAELRALLLDQGERAPGQRSLNAH